MSINISKEQVISDFRLAHVSRHMSLLGRKEVLGGKAKFGIFGDGKELAQLALAKCFRNGDFRSGYYRDQTWMLALGILSPESFFAQLYGDTDLEHNPDNGGRLMNNHFASRSLHADGTWKNLMAQPNSSADISPTAGQMPRLLGLAYASKLYRNIPELHSFTQFSDRGNEVAFGSIGDSSTSEGLFFETINAAGVLQVPMAISVWDDGYGISVSNKYQTTKQNISEILKGFEKEPDTNGYYIYKAKGWDYEELLKVYNEGVEKCRAEHVPVLFHIREMTQPQGHSTSGSHERYKSKERLDWELAFDPILKFREYILQQNFASEAELDAIELSAKDEVLQAKNLAWKRFMDPILKEREELLEIIEYKSCICNTTNHDKISEARDRLSKVLIPVRKDNFAAVKHILRNVCLTCIKRKSLQGDLQKWLDKHYAINKHRYSSHLYSQSAESVLNVPYLPVAYNDNAPMINGREILRDNFDKLFEKYPNLVTFGEDTGKIGDVNQGLEGLQKKYGEFRITDTGIREATIMGQAIGLAMRGIRPIAEIQYFDYLLYALQLVSDDLATLQYRTVGGQKAPVIIRTRGHRLEGVWHSGSPLSMVINSIRGVYVCVPRNMTQAAGFYNTLVHSDDAALVIEPLNGYRLKEKMPANLGEYFVPLGVPEVLHSGSDITLVTYGSCVKIAEDAIMQLAEFNVSVELIDVQTLLPFDLNGVIGKSIQKTNKVVFFDEDVPGGATAFMMQKVIEDQNVFDFLDAAPRTLSGEDHRPAYATDGDYFSNPNAEDVFELLYGMMHDANPAKYPKLY